MGLKPLSYSYSTSQSKQSQRLPAAESHWNQFFYILRYWTVKAAVVRWEVKVLLLGSVLLLQFGQSHEELVSPLLPRPQMLLVVGNQLTHLLWTRRSRWKMCHFTGEEDGRSQLCLLIHLSHHDTAFLWTPRHPTGKLGTKSTESSRFWGRSGLF